MKTLPALIIAILLVCTLDLIVTVAVYGNISRLTGYMLEFAKAMNELVEMLKTDAGLKV